MVSHREGILCALHLLPYLYFWQVLMGLTFSPKKAAEIGVSGGTDGPTAIITSSAPLPMWLIVVVAAVILVVCVILAVRVWKLEKKLK